MEYCPYGQLYDVLHDGKQLPACLLCDWAKQITSGMTYLHSHKIIHRDLKSPKYVETLTVPCCPFNSESTINNALVSPDTVAMHAKF